MISVYNVHRKRKCLDGVSTSVFQSIEKLIVSYSDAHRFYFLEWNTAKVGVMEQSAVYLNQVLI